MHLRTPWGPPQFPFDPSHCPFGIPRDPYMRYPESDNMRAVCCFKQGRARSSTLCTEMINLSNWCACHQIILSAVHLPGIHHKLDSLSRHFSRDSKRELYNLVIENVFQQWDPHLRTSLGISCSLEMQSAVARGLKVQVPKERHF